MAIDGKTVRRSADKANGESPIHMASAWANMNGVAIIESTRWADGKTTVHRRRFITSLPARADRILGAVRERWGVENGLHWTPARRSGRTGA